MFSRATCVPVCLSSLQSLSLQCVSLHCRFAPCCGLHTHFFIISQDVSVRAVHTRDKLLRNAFEMASFGGDCNSKQRATTNSARPRQRSWLYVVLLELRRAIASYFALLRTVCPETTRLATITNAKQNMEMASRILFYFVAASLCGCRRCSAVGST